METEIIKKKVHERKRASLGLSPGQRLTCGKSGLSSLDFLMQSATSLFMALGQFL